MIRHGFDGIREHVETAANDIGTPEPTQPGARAKYNTATPTRRRDIIIRGRGIQTAEGAPATQ